MKAKLLRLLVMRMVEDRKENSCVITQCFDDKKWWVELWTEQQTTKNRQTYKMTWINVNDKWWVMSDDGSVSLAELIRIEELSNTGGCAKLICYYKSNQQQAKIVVISF